MCSTVFDPGLILTPAKYSYKTFQNMHSACTTRGGSRKFRKTGPRPPPFPPPGMKTSLCRTCSNKVTLKFQKRFENTRKKAGGGGRRDATPLVPPLNPPMTTKEYFLHKAAAPALRAAVEFELSYQFSGQLTEIRSLLNLPWPS